MLGNSFLQIIGLTYIKFIVLLAMKDIDKEFHNPIQKYFVELSGIEPLTF